MLYTSQYSRIEVKRNSPSDGDSYVFRGDVISQKQYVEESLAKACYSVKFENLGVSTQLPVGLLTT